ncbi:Argininosuccinate synthase, partial [Haemophilus influenzae]
FNVVHSIFLQAAFLTSIQRLLVAP